MYSIYMYIAPRSKIESRAHYASERAQGTRLQQAVETAKEQSEQRLTVAVDSSTVSSDDGCRVS